MKKAITTLVLLMLTIAVNADTYNYLIITNSSGTETALSLSNLVITYSDGNLTATNDEGTTNLTLSNLATMILSESNVTTGITQISDSGEEDMITIYNAGGVKMLQTVFGNTASLNELLPKGIYIIKEKGQTRKLFVK